MGWPLALKRCWKTLSYYYRNQRKELVEAFHHGWNEWPPAFGILKSQRLWLESSWPQFDHMSVTGYMAPWKEGSFQGPRQLGGHTFSLRLDGVGEGWQLSAPSPHPPNQSAIREGDKRLSCPNVQILQLGAAMCLRNLGISTFLNLMLRCSKSPAYKTLSPSFQNLEKKSSRAIKGLYFNVYDCISQLFCRINLYHVTWKEGQIFP